MVENANLRKLVGSLSDFIGKGLGGLVSELGLSSEGIEAIAAEGYFDLLQRSAAEIDKVAQKKQRESADPPTHWTKQPDAADVPAAPSGHDQTALAAQIKASLSRAASPPGSSHNVPTHGMLTRSESSELDARLPISTSFLATDSAIPLLPQNGSFSTVQFSSNPWHDVQLLPSFSSHKPVAMSTAGPSSGTVSLQDQAEEQDNVDSLGSSAFADLVVPGIFSSPRASTSQLPSRGYLEVQAMQLID